MTGAGKHGAGPWRASLLTLFPEVFPGPLGLSLAGGALKAGLWALETVDIRRFARDKYRAVDDSPAGGGPGMVMRADVLGRAIDDVHGAGDPRPLVCLSPRGERLTQDLVRQFAAAPGVVVVCGRFEGIDERVLQARPVREVSVGDYVLSGGDVAAFCLLDAIVRILPGVVGAPESLLEESFEEDLLEYPHYTRPQIWEGREIPAVLNSGHHANIKAWRQDKAEKITRKRRPDLWASYQATRNSVRKKD